MLEEIAEYIFNNIQGWCGAKGASLIPVGEVVADARGGNHLEIGTLWGASAIMAALVKQRLGLDGKVYCIDPFKYELHEPCSRRGGNVTRARAEAMPEIFTQNLHTFDVVDRIELIQKKSQPFPTELKGVRFASAFIDGWHYGDTPRKDIESVARVTDKYIILDDVLPYYPAVMRAFTKMIQNKKWWFMSLSDRAAVFGRLSSKTNIWSHISQPIAPENLRLPEYLR